MAIKYNCEKNGKKYFRLTVTVNGKRKDFYGDGEKDAIRKRDKYLETHAGVTSTEFLDMPFGDAFSYWLYKIKRLDRNIKPSTFNLYECAYRTHISKLSIHDIGIADLTTLDIQRTLSKHYEEACSYGRIKFTYTLLRMFFNYLYETGMLVRNPCARVTLPNEERQKQKKEIEIFTLEEQKQIRDYMAASNYKKRMLIEMALATGMRLSELTALTWSDIHDNIVAVSKTAAVISVVSEDASRNWEKKIWTPKSQNGNRQIPLPAHIIPMLKHYKAEQAEACLARGVVPSLVFTSYLGEQFTPSCITDSYKRMLKRAGVDYKKFHTLRHTYITMLVKAEVPLPTVQALAGHAQLSTTMLYTHTDLTDKIKAVEKLSLLTDVGK